MSVLILVHSTSYISFREVLIWRLLALCIVNEPFPRS